MKKSTIMQLKTIYFIFFFALFVSCSSDHNVDDVKHIKDSIAMIYDDDFLDFKEIRKGKYTNENREIIGFFIESELILDSIHKNKVLLVFRTDFNSHIKFEGIEFSPFTSNPLDPEKIFAYVYQYTDSESNSPFTIDLRLENNRVKGKFEGYIHRSNDPWDRKYMTPIYLSNGEIDVDINQFK